MCPGQLLDHSWHVPQNVLMAGELCLVLIVLDQYGVCKIEEIIMVGMGCVVVVESSV